jgi:hypothetical protein
MASFGDYFNVVAIFVRHKAKDWRQHRYWQLEINKLLK